MPKEVPEKQLRQIVGAIEGKLEGISAVEIRGILEFELPVRTLQRRLKRLEDEGTINTRGTGKGKRYYPKTEELGTMGNLLRETQEIGHYRTKRSIISLSPQAMEIRSIVRGPLGKRKPVGYRSAFLETYTPNKTFYLDQDLREELARLGQVGVSDLPAGTYVRQVLDRLLIDLSWNSSRLEGNTYTLLETERLVALGEDADGKNVTETQMILNHKAAIEMLADQAEEIGFNRYTICNLHAVLSDNLMPDPTACGRVRSRAVGIGGSVYHPLEVPTQIESSFLQILEKAEAIEDPFEQAFFAMVQMPYLQPFMDVNKRVSRLAANIPLVKYNLCPLSFTDVPQEDYINGLIGVYELNRVEYLRDVFVWAYKRSAARYSAVLESLGDPDPFRLRYRTQIGDLVRGVVQGGMGKMEGEAWIGERSKTLIEVGDMKRFLNVMETELVSLHEGNIARYRLRPREFSAWKEGWG